MKPWKIQGIGFCLFAAAFLFPAVGNVSFESGPGTASGWYCAYFTAMDVVFFPEMLYRNHGNVGLSEWLLMLSGFVVPFVLVYLLLCILAKARMARLYLAVAILIGVVAAWLYFYTQFNVPDTQRTVPLIGHYIWILGILIMLSPEILSRFLDRES